jgi:hypothetical protein
MGKWNKAFKQYEESHDIEGLRDDLKALIERVLQEAKILRG